ncbi:MAG: hypothetical protein V3T28_07110 [Gemmatimonadales bacterium]
MAAKGRYWFAVWLAFLLAVLVWVNTRQTSALVAAVDLVEVRTERSAAEAEKAVLLRRIREGGSRAILIPRAESLGLRLPADTEIVILQVPAPEMR